MGLMKVVATVSHTVCGKTCLFWRMFVEGGMSNKSQLAHLHLTLIFDMRHNIKNSQDSSVNEFFENYDR